MVEAEISIDKIAAIRAEHGNEGLGIYLFYVFHEKLFSRMDSKLLKEFLKEIKAECDKDTFLYIKIMVDLEEKFRDEHGK